MADKASAIQISKVKIAKRDLIKKINRSLESKNSLAIKIKAFKRARQ